MVMPEPTKDAKTIEVDTNASAPAPAPPILAVEAVLGVLVADEAPIGTLMNPAATVPALEDAQALEVVTDAAAFPPEPTV